MAKSSDLIPKTGVRFGPLSGIATEDSIYPGTSPEGKAINEQRYSLRDAILAGTMGGTYSTFEAPIPSLINRGDLANIDLQKEVSDAISKRLGIEPIGLF